MPTNIPYGSDLANSVQSAGLFTTTMGRKTKLGRLAGDFPKQASAEDKMRRQTSVDYPIVRCRDLQKAAGDEVQFDFVNPLKGKPIMGDQTAEGHGESMVLATDKLRVNQMRKPVSAGSVMTQQRTPHQIKAIAKTLGEKYMAAIEDETTLYHLAGDRGFFNNAECMVPLASDADFSSIMVNSLRAPSFNRHYLATSTGITGFAASGNEVTIASTGLMSMSVIDALKQTIDTLPFAPSPCKFEGDVMAEDDPLRVLLVSPHQYMQFKQSSSNAYRTFQAQALARSSRAKDNPLFMGDALLWEGILIVKMPKPVRFYAGDILKHCTSATSATEVITDLVPSSFSTTYAVDRAILLGGQALAEAFGKHFKSGSPYYMSEKYLDHDNNLEISFASIGGKSKVRFSYDFGDAGSQPTDHGVIAIDTVVKL